MAFIVAPLLPGPNAAMYSDTKLSAVSSMTSCPMIRLSITAAFEAIARTLRLGSVGYENEVNECGERYIWLEPKVVDRVRALRPPRTAATSFSGSRLRGADQCGARRSTLAFAGLASRSLSFVLPS
jgi:hypothetical protein